MKKQMTRDEYFTMIKDASDFFKERIVEYKDAKTRLWQLEQLRKSFKFLKMEMRDVRDVGSCQIVLLEEQTLCEAILNLAIVAAMDAKIVIEKDITLKHHYFCEKDFEIIGN